MSIVKMDRITVIGLRQEQTAVIEALMRLGAIDIDEEAGPDRQAALPEQTGVRVVSLSVPEPGDADAPAGDLPQLMARLQQAIAACAKIRPLKMPFLAKKRSVTAGQFQLVIGSQMSILADLARFEESGSRIAEIDSQLVRLQSTAAMLAPWAGLRLDLSYKRSLKTRSFLGSFKTRHDLESLESILQNEAPESITQVLSEDETGLQVHIITLRIRENLVLAGLRRSNFAFLPVQDESATPRELLDRIRAEQGELLADRERETGRRYAIAGRLVDFEMLHDHLQMQNDKALVLGRLAETGRTFYLKGWIPSNLAASLERSLMQHFTVAVESRPARPDEPFPILLRNSKLLKPYEVVVEMFNPPLPSEVDPTPILAPFYFSLLRHDVQRCRLRPDPDRHLRRRPVQVQGQRPDPAAIPVVFPMRPVDHFLGRHVRRLFRQHDRRLVRRPLQYPAGPVRSAAGTDDSDADERVTRHHPFVYRHGSQGLYDDQDRILDRRRAGRVPLVFRDRRPTDDLGRHRQTFCRVCRPGGFGGHCPVFIPRQS